MSGVLHSRNVSAGGEIDRRRTSATTYSLELYARVLREGTVAVGDKVILGVP